jgi:hypothetical protein
MMRDVNPYRAPHNDTAVPVVDSFAVDFVEPAPIERLSELFDSLRVDSTG